MFSYISDSLYSTKNVIEGGQRDYRLWNGALGRYTKRWIKKNDIVQKQQEFEIC